MKYLVRIFSGCFFFFYLLPMSVIGTVMLFGIAFLHLPHNKMDKREYALESLPNGFVYDSRKDFGDGVIRDAQGNVIVHQAVGTFKWQGSTVYGKRYGLSDFEVYYFVCDYGADCLKSQNYGYSDFSKILKQRNLPGFKEITSFRAQYNGYLY